MNTRNKETLLDEYKMGDVQQRLHLFLEYPDLRQTFMGIDEKEAFMQSQVRGAAQAGPCRRAVRRLAFVVNSLLGVP